MSRLLLISGSPKKGNTDQLLSRIFDEWKGEKEMILLREQNIHHCLGCRFCEKGNGCAIKDDMTKLLQKLLRADIIVLGSPNYFANVSGITKDFIDRTLPLHQSQELKGKKIFLVMPGASADETNEKYLIQGTYGFIKYQHMELLGAYGWCTEDTETAEQKVEDITKHILTKLSE